MAGDQRGKGKTRRKWNDAGGQTRRLETRASMPIHVRLRNQTLRESGGPVEMNRAAERLSWRPLIELRGLVWLPARGLSLAFKPLVHLSVLLNRNDFALISAAAQTLNLVMAIIEVWAGGFEPPFPSLSVGAFMTANRRNRDGLQTLLTPTISSWRNTPRCYVIAGSMILWARQPSIIGLQCDAMPL